MIEPVVMTPPVLQRAGGVAIGLAAVFIGFALVASDSLGWIFVPLCGLIVLVEGIRTRVVVDMGHATVTSTRAFRRVTIPVGDIVNVRVPPWGPMALTLRKGASKRGGGIWPGQVLTGLYADRRGAAADLASTLGVPLVSIWPRFRSDGSYSEPQARFDLRTWSGVATWLLTLMLGAMAAVMLVALVLAL